VAEVKGVRIAKFIDVSQLVVVAIVINNIEKILRFEN
jgi:hypothetical protein